MQSSTTTKMVIHGTDQATKLKLHAEDKQYAQAWHAARYRYRQTHHLLAAIATKPSQMAESGRTLKGQQAWDHGDLWRAFCFGGARVLRIAHMLSNLSDPARSVSFTLCTVSPAPCSPCTKLSYFLPSVEPTNPVPPLLRLPHAQQCAPHELMRRRTSNRDSRRFALRVGVTIVHSSCATTDKPTWLHRHHSRGGHAAQG